MKGHSKIGFCISFRFPSTIGYRETVLANGTIVEKFPMPIRLTWHMEIWYSKRLYVNVPAIKSLSLWATPWVGNRVEKSKREVVL